VGGQHLALGGGFAGRVGAGRVRAKRRGLVDVAQVTAVVHDAGRAGVDEPRDLRLAAGRQEIARAFNVNAEKIRRRAPHANAAGDVEHRFGRPAAALQGVAVMQVAGNHLGAARREFRHGLAGQHADAAAIGQQALGEFATDEPAGAGEEDGEVLADGEHGLTQGRVGHKKHKMAAASAAYKAPIGARRFSPA
jgi:hypothetical protein